MIGDVPAAHEDQEDHRESEEVAFATLAVDFVGEAQEGVEEAEDGDAKGAENLHCEIPRTMRRHMP